MDIPCPEIPAGRPPAPTAEPRASAPIARPESGALATTGGGPVRPDASRAGADRAAGLGDAPRRRRPPPSAARSDPAPPPPPRSRTSPPPRPDATDAAPSAGQRGTCATLWSPGWSAASSARSSRPGVYVVVDDDATSTVERARRPAPVVVRPSDRIDTRPVTSPRSCKVDVPAVVAIVDDGGPDSGGARGHRLRHLVRRRHRHQQPRRRRRRRDPGACSPTARRSTPRCSARDPASDLAVVKVEATGPPDHRARRLRPGAGRRRRRRDRQRARARGRAQRHARDRLRAAPRRSGTDDDGVARRRDPDRRRDQPRQLGRPARRRAGSGHRHQHRDRRSRRTRRTSASPSRSRRPRSIIERAARRQAARVPRRAPSTSRRRARRSRRRRRRCYVGRSATGHAGRQGRASSAATWSCRSTTRRSTRGVARRRDPRVPPRRSGSEVDVVVTATASATTLTRHARRGARARSS